MSNESDFYKYESHIDSIINQYKQQLESIKKNRKDSEKIDNQKLELNDNSLIVKLNTISNNDKNQELNKNSLNKSITDEKKLNSFIDDNQNFNSTVKQKAILSTLTPKRNNENLNIKSSIVIDNENLTSELENIKSENNTLKKKYEELETKYDSIKNQVSKIEKLEFENKNLKEETQNIFNRESQTIISLNKSISELQNIIKEKNKEIENFKSRYKSQTNNLNDHFIPKELITFLNKLICAISGDKEYKNQILDANKNLQFCDIELFLNLIENFIVKIGINHQEIEQKCLLLEKKSHNFENLLFQEESKNKKLNEVITDLKEENKYLKDQLSSLTTKNEEKAKLGKSKKKKKSNDEKDKAKKSVLNKEPKKSTKSINDIKIIKNDSSSQKAENISVKKNELSTIAHEINDNSILGKNKNVSKQKIPIDHKRIPNLNKEDIIDPSIRNFENLKQKIRDLENKIYEINNDEKEKKIIESLRDFRNRNQSNNQKN